MVDLELAEKAIEAKIHLSTQAAVKARTGAIIAAAARQQALRLPGQIQARR